MKHGGAIRIIVKLSIIMCMLFFLPIVAFSEVPQQINFQGFLTDQLGTPVDGDYQMVFSIYDVPTEGTALWSESQTVLVINGIYNVQIGQDPIGNPFPGNLFDGQRWLGVTVESDTEMTPRQPLTCTPFAMRAEVADTVAEGGVNTVHLMDNAVTGAKIDDGTVVAADLGDGTVLAEIRDDDGAGSGLDADLLDGHDTAYFATAAMVTALQNHVVALQSQVDQLTALLVNVSRPDPDTLRFANVNVQIVNGTGTTAGTGNGLGNLIVGYNENTVAALRTGSHNLVVGIDHEYTSYAGLLAGRRNRISGVSSSVMGYRNEVTANYGSVSGGYQNIASSPHSSVSGGHSNNADGSYSTVSGGYGNSASGYSSSVSGGQSNEASGFYSSVSGGQSNMASGDHASVSGGYNNMSSGDWSFVGGGGGSESSLGNQAFGDYSAILGGLVNIAGDPDLTDHTIGEQASICGGRDNITSGYAASVSGGIGNMASASYSSVSGGRNNAASGFGSSVSGGKDNEASGHISFVGGGGGIRAIDGNIAFADYSAILGGLNNLTGDGSCSYDYSVARSVCTGGSDHTIGKQATVSGGVANTASDLYSSVSGGYSNKASGDSSSVSGGKGNTASAFNSSVSGGNHNTASGENSSVSGGENNEASGYGSFVGGGGGENAIDGNIAFADYSAILGGLNNLTGDGSCSYDAGAGRFACTGGSDHTKAPRATVSGGAVNVAFAETASVSGGFGNWGVGLNSSVSGGWSNQAMGDNSSVSGGSSNTAIGENSSVSGGYNRSVSGTYDWRAGTLFEEQ